MFIAAFIHENWKLETAQVSISKNMGKQNTQQHEWISENTMLSESSHTQNEVYVPSNSIYVKLKERLI